MKSAESRPKNFSTGSPGPPAKYASESIKNVRVAAVLVSPNDGYVMKNVSAWVVSAVVKWNQSSPSPSVRSTGSNASAGFVKRIGANGVPGQGPPKSRLMFVGIVSLGSNTSSFRTFVVAVSRPNTPAPRKKSWPLCAGGGTQNDIRPRPVALSRTREKGTGLGRMSFWVPPPAHSGQLFFLGAGVFGLDTATTNVLKDDVFEPNDTIPTNINLDLGGPWPGTPFAPILFTNPALAFEPVDRNIGLGEDWFRFSVSDSTQPMTFFITYPSSGDTAGTPTVLLRSLVYATRTPSHP